MSKVGTRTKGLGSKNKIAADRQYAKGQREKAKTNRARRAHARMFELMAGWRA